MPSKKNAVVIVARRTISEALGIQARPSFKDTNLVLGDWRGFIVQVQFDSAYLHGISAPTYWMRCYLQTGTKYRTVLRYATGQFVVAKGVKGTGAEFSSDFPFATDAEMEATLNELGAVLNVWDPEEAETAR